MFQVGVCHQMERPEDENLHAFLFVGGDPPYLGEGVAPATKKTSGGFRRLSVFLWRRQTGEYLYIRTPLNTKTAIAILDTDQM